jgi:hypothetical protein
MEEIISEDDIEYEYIYDPNTLLKSCTKDNDYNDIATIKLNNNKTKKKKEKINLFFNTNQNVNTNQNINTRKFNPRLPPYKLNNKL